MNTNLNYGIIGNCKSAALINEDTSIDWLCLPQFDSPSVFAKILDDKKGGNFLIKNLANYTIKQAYICLLYTSPSPRDLSTSRMPSSA